MVSGTSACSRSRQRNKTPALAEDCWKQQNNGPWIAGGTEIRMTVVNVRAALIEWYKRRGYEMTHETRPFPYGDERFGTPKRDDLYFVVLQKRLSQRVQKPSSNV